MGGYSVMAELNQAIDLFMQFNIEKDKFGTLEDLAKQGAMFEEPSAVGIELAKKMQLNQKEFADFMQKMNASLEIGASGQSDIFLGDVETKDEVLKRVLDLKKAIQDVLENMRKAKSYKELAVVMIKPDSSGSGHKLQGRAKVQGMDISIENKKGSVRSGTDKNGKAWSQKMGWDYGYIRGTVGKDKDHVDCFLGPNQ
jgi:hypothetical protein